MKVPLQEMVEDGKLFEKRLISGPWHLVAPDEVVKRYQAAAEECRRVTTITSQALALYEQGRQDGGQAARKALIQIGVMMEAQPA